MNQSYVDHQAYEWEGCFESLENSFVSVEPHHKTLCHTTELSSLRTVEISNPKIALPNKNSTWTRSTIRNSEKNTLQNGATTHKDAEAHHRAIGWHAFSLEQMIPMP